MNGEDIINQALARLDEIEAEIAPQLAERAKLRAWVNQACEFAGREPMFDLGEGEFRQAAQAAAPTMVVNGRPPRGGGFSIKSDQFFSLPLATAVRDYLELRKAADMGPASAEEIHDSLVKGGFAFPTKDVENQKRGLQVSLSKNTVTFRKLPNGLYGLAGWYP